MFPRLSIEHLQRILVVFVFPLAVASCDGDNGPMAPGGAGPTAPSGWFWQNPLPQGNTLNAMHFANATTGTAVGGGGTILRTTDGRLSKKFETQLLEWSISKTLPDYFCKTGQSRGGDVEFLDSLAPGAGKHPT